MFNQVLGQLKSFLPAQHTMRMSVCKQCPRLEKPLNVCAECGCFMDAKVMIKTAKCPLDKW